jgi:hypothetical protein
MFRSLRASSDISRVTFIQYALACGFYRVGAGTGEAISLDFIGDAYRYPTDLAVVDLPPESVLEPILDVHGSRIRSLRLQIGVASHDTIVMALQKCPGLEDLRMGFYPFAPVTAASIVHLAFGRNDGSLFSAYGNLYRIRHIIDAIPSFPNLRELRYGSFNWIEEAEEDELLDVCASLNIVATGSRL